MKKTALLAAITLASTIYGNDKPPHLSLLLQYANILVAQPSQTYMQSKDKKQSYHVAMDVFLSSSYNIVNVPISYIYNNKFGISCYIPYVESNLEHTQKQSSLGDTTVEISFNGGKFDKEIQDENNIFGLRYTFATGSKSKNLTATSDSIAIFWDSTYVLNNQWSMFGSLLWNFYLDDTTINGTSYELGSEDILFFGGKYKGAFNNTTNLAAKLNWQGSYNEIPEENYDMVDITVEAESSKLIKNFPCKVGIKLPIWSNDEVKNEVMFFVGVSSSF